MPPEHHQQEIIEMELPRWMVKQLRGCAIYSKEEAMTKEGEKSAEQIIELLTFYLREER